MAVMGLKRGGISAEELFQVQQRQQVQLLATLDERPHVGESLPPVDGVQPGGDCLSPILRLQRGLRPLGLPQRLVEVFQVGLRPCPVGEIPEKIANFGDGSCFFVFSASGSPWISEPLFPSFAKPASRQDSRHLLHLPETTFLPISPKKSRNQVPSPCS